jgi:hypothetical protein
VSGGVLIYKDVGGRPYWRAKANRRHDLVMARERVRYTPLPEVKAWTAELGMNLLTSERVNTLWYAHDLCVFRGGTKG